MHWSPKAPRGSREIEAPMGGGGRWWQVGHTAQLLLFMRHGGSLGVLAVPSIAFQHHQA